MFRRQRDQFSRLGLSTLCRVFSVLCRTKALRTSGGRGDHCPEPFRAPVKKEGFFWPSSASELEWAFVRIPPWVEGQPSRRNSNKCTKSEWSAVRRSITCPRAACVPTSRTRSGAERLHHRQSRSGVQREAREGLRSWKRNATGITAWGPQSEEAASWFFPGASGPDHCGAFPRN